MTKKLRLAILILLLPALTPLYSQVCDCLSTGNCPVPIQDNGTFYGTLDVTVNGPNNLAACPLTQVCFSITHTWVGDLSVTLTSPGGLNYILMGDSNNGTGGCGNQEDNIDVCITTGVGNALTNNTEYMCNTGPCFSGSCCLTGFWTMPCGGVSDPMSGAQQAPGCDLNAFNQPGQPANGTWTLAVNDVCQQDVGTLNNFSLTFACGTLSCIVCEADGGTLPGQNIATCFGNPSLNLNLNPIYSGAPPPPGEYGYAYVLSQNGIITSINPTADLSFQPPGVYQVCGISYIQTALGNVQSLVGMNLTAAQNLLSTSTAPYCADFSTNCITVTIGPAILPTFFDTLVCVGDCIDFGGHILCGSGPVTLQSWLGCDSVVNVVMIPIPPIISQQTMTICQGDCVTINNQTYCPPGPHVFALESWQGCDSTITLFFNTILTTAIILPPVPPAISCSNPTTTLDGLSSVPAMGPNVTYAWSGPNFNSTAPTVTVNSPGVYTLTVTNNSATPPCISTAHVTVTGNQNGPDLQLNSPPPSICQGGSFNLSTLNVVDLNGTMPTISFHSATPATAANVLPSTTVSPTTTTTYYILGTTGNCTDEIPVTVTVNPIPTATFDVTSPICIDSTATVTYTGTAGANATFNWNFGGGTATPGTGPGPHTVEWASGGTKTITLSVTQSGCASQSVSHTVAVNTQIPAPVINCAPMTGTITFTWNPIAGATGYNVTPAIGPPGTMVNDTTYQVTGLNPGEQVSIFVEAISGNACPGSSTQITCTAQDCPPITVTIAPVADICLDGTAGPVLLVASQTGGVGDGVYTWSGPGVNPINGMFNPANANLGANNVVVTYEEGTCLYNVTRVINVFPQPTANFTVTSPICVSDNSTINYTGNASNNATFTWDFAGGTATPGIGPGPHAVTWPSGGSYLVSLMVEEDGCASDTLTHTVTVEDEMPVPVIDCNGTTETIEFFWNEIPGASGYDIVVVGGGTGTPTSDTSILFTGLNPGDDVTIQVTALNPGACGNSSAQETCIAQDCPPVTIAIDPVAVICLDAAAMPFDLTATVNGSGGSGTLSWSGTGITDPAAGTFDPNLANLGNNTITATFEENSCIFTQDITITVRAQPVASFTVETPVCEGEVSKITYTGTVQAGITFDWDFGAGTAVPGGASQGPHNVTWTDSGPHDISLTVTNASGCVSEVFVETVQVDEPLVAPAITCMSTTTTVQFNWPNVPGATDYDVTVLTGQTGTQPTQNSFLVGNLVPDDAVTISLSVSNGGACPPVVVQQTCIAKECPPIVVDVQPVPALCISAASPVQLVADVTGGAGTGTGAWSGPGVVGSTFDATAAGTGQHTIFYTYEEASCIYEDSTKIAVFSEPAADFTVTSVICEADATTVTYTGNAAPGAAYTWDFDGGSATPGTGPGPHQVTWPAAGNYQISLTVTQDGCTSTEVTQNVQVDAELVAPNINCNSTTSSVEFTWNQVPGATDYEVQILAGQTGTQPTNTNYLVTGLTPGDEVILQLTVSGPTVCPAVVIQEACTAMECPPVVVDITPVDPICLTALPELVNLEAAVTGSVTGGTGTWSGNGITDPATGIFDPAVAGLGNHTVTFNYIESGCPFNDAIQIQVAAPPAANAGADATLTCKEDQTETELGGANGNSSGPNISYLWSAASGAFPGDSTVLHPVVSEPGTYTLTVMNTALGCEATDVVVVDASQDIPVPEISLSPISCFGDDNGAISVVSVSGGMEPYLFSLNGSPFSSTSTFQQLKPGVYELAVVDADGCENLLTIDIQEPQEVNVELIVYVEGGNIIHLGDSAQLEALLSLPFDSLDIIDWEPDSLLSCDGCPDPVAHPIQTTTFTVRVEKDGCSDSDKATIFVRKDRVLFVPNAFSPNNDGINDVFLVFAGPQVARVKSFLVFDRWGETVYQYYDFPPNDSAYGWDGTHRGKKFNPAVFTWFAEIEFVDGATEIFEGDVSLMR